MKESQCDAILKCLKEHRVITSLGAFKLCGTLACHSRISDLRREGHIIRTEHKNEGRKRWAEYHYEGDRNGEQLNLFQEGA